MCSNEVLPVDAVRQIAYSRSFFAEVDILGECISRCVA